jgi:hypothetical protein
MGKSAGATRDEDDVKSRFSDPQDARKSFDYATTSKPHDWRASKARNNLLDRVQSSSLLYIHLRLCLIIILNTAWLFWASSTPPRPAAEQKLKARDNKPKRPDMSRSFDVPPLTPQFCFNQTALRGITLPCSRTRRRHSLTNNQISSASPAIPPTTQ